MWISGSGWIKRQLRLPAARWVVSIDKAKKAWQTKQIGHLPVHALGRLEEAHREAVDWLSSSSPIGMCQDSPCSPYAAILTKPAYIVLLWCLETNPHPSKERALLSNGYLNLRSGQSPRRSVFSLHIASVKLYVSKYCCHTPTCPFQSKQ